jgi:hypothetical protein
MIYNFRCKANVVTGEFPKPMSPLDLQPRMSERRVDSGQADSCATCADDCTMIVWWRYESVSVLFKGVASNMKLAQSLSFLLLVFSLAMGTLAHAGTYTATSCNESDVNAVINGPAHKAVDGDMIIIPAGTCTWTSSLFITVGITITGSGTANSGASTFGAGAPTTIIVDNAGSSNPLIEVTSITYGQTFVLSLLDIEPESASTALWSPISIAGTCTSSGCPNMRVDNIVFGLTTQWNESGNGSSADWMIRADNVFGVIDHSTLPNGSMVELLNANLSAYLGVGGNGDNSWAQPDSFGGPNVLYMENNIVYTNQAVNDCDTAPAGGAVGGCRVAGRFNQINPEPGFFVAFMQHGLDTDGRPQGGRQIEAYGNTINCNIGGGCAGGVAAFRSGTGFVFGNTLNANFPVSGGFYNTVASITVYRTVFTTGSGWGACGGSGAYDTNDGTVYYSGTNSGSGGLTTLTDSAKSWTTNQFTPTGAPYSVYDVTQGWWAEIASNTATTLTIQPSIPEQTNTFSNGDSYQILRATVCADQGGRGAGNYVSGSASSPVSALSQALDPIYEWNDTANNLNHGNISSDTLRTIPNRDWYTDGSNGSPQAQTSPTSPFNGTSGVGFGTPANRPTSCKTGVGYAEYSGSNFVQLDKCTATNTWISAAYTTYVYPHPLESNGSTPGPGPSAPANLKGTAH